ncbi:diguanylate cyclase [Gammaproteobacteria bacterium]
MFVRFLLVNYPGQLVGAQGFHHGGGEGVFLSITLVQDNMSSDYQGDDVIPLLDEQDEIPLLDDQKDSAPRDITGNWRILVVDDDTEVHHATRYALHGVSILGRDVELVHVFSGAEAASLLQQDSDFAVILLDVVMEANDAGLQLINRIRLDMKLEETRIVLRTGQPGYAPPLEVLTHYDINDYRSKSELNQPRLLATIITALRSYQHIHAINVSQRALRSIVHATSELMSHRGLGYFVSGVITQLAELLDVPLNGFIVVEVGLDESNKQRKTCVLATTEAYQQYLHQALSEVQDGCAREMLEQAIAEKHHILTDQHHVLFFKGDRYQLAAYLDIPRPHLDQHMEILELFCSNVTLCANNLALIDQLHDLAYLDTLTGLSNRTQFLLDVDKSYQDPQAAIDTLALLDVDYFNALVGTIGYSMADQVLQGIGQRLQDRFPVEQVFIARLAADTFGLLGPHSLINVDQLQSLFATPLTLEHTSLPITATIGIASLHEGWSSSTAVIAGAFMALKEAKYRQRGGIKIYTSDMGREMESRMEVMHELSMAIRGQVFFLVFQPQIHLSTGRVVGIEALIRWRRPDGSMIPPDRFIPISENTGMIIDIGTWVFETACRQLKQLHALGWKQTLMGINASVAQFHDSRFLSMIERTLQSAQLPPQTIKIEITETMAMQEIGLVTSTIDAVKRIGLRVALDDFGTGFSSLAYLQRLNIDRLKVDRSFVCDLNQGTHGNSIVRVIATLGHELGMEVLAEGVETAEQSDCLKEMGYDTAQGYFFARPMEFSTLLDWLAARDKPLPG